MAATAGTLPGLEDVSALPAEGITSIDLFVVRTISFKLLYGLVILRHARRWPVTVSVTTSPTAERIAGQVTEAFPWDEALGHLTRDPRWGLRSGVSAPDSCDEDPGSSDGAALTVAKRSR
jgi:hypothetical protein